MKLLFGFILGFIFTMFWVGFDLAWDQKNNPIANFSVTLANDLDGNLVTNIAIAIATIVASVIAMTNYYSSQKNREWEIRKEPLFKLLKALTQSMESTQELYGNALAEQVGEQHSSGEVAGEMHIGIDSELNELLNVYKPLFPQSIIQAVGFYIQKDKSIAYDYKHDVCDIIEAYSRLWDAQEELQHCLINYLEEIARIKNT